jgi:outer membrane protein OmpA-like peptidoglycan-associated protein
MPDDTSPSSPDFTKVGFGAMGNVEVKHDASQHTTHSTTQHSQAHHEDKSTSYNNHVTHQKTTQVSGMHPLLVLALVAILIIGGVLMVMALKPASQTPAATTPPAPSVVIMPQPPVISALPTIQNAEVGVMVGGQFTPRTSFKNGELLTLRLRVSRDCHVRVLYQPAQGDPMLIFPEKGDGSNFVLAGVDLFIPDPAKLAAQSPDATAFKLIHDFGSGPPIQEQVVVQIADEPFAADGTSPAVGTPYRAYPGMTLADARTRGVVRLKGLVAAAAQAKMDQALSQKALPFSIMPCIKIIMKASLQLLIPVLWVSTLSAQTPADGSAMKAGAIADQWKTSPATLGIGRTRGITTRSAVGAPPTPTLRTRGAGLSQTAVDANADALENLRSRGMAILKGAEAAAAQQAQDQNISINADSRQKAESAAPPPPAFVQVPVVAEKQIAFRLRFKKDSTDLADAETASLVSFIATAMKDLPDAIFLLEGHTCDLGEDAHNQRLSEARDLRIRTLLGDMGIPSNRLLSIGQGERHCELPNTSDYNRALNRRVVIGPIELPKKI